MWLGVLLVVVGAALSNREHQTRSIAADVREALAHAGYSIKAAAIEMHIDRSQLRRQLDGNGHLALDRVACLSVEFQQWFAVMRARRHGVPEEVQVGLRLHRVGMLKEKAS